MLFDGEHVLGAIGVIGMPLSKGFGCVNEIR
jgi:hypothetical protein